MSDIHNRKKRLRNAINRFERSDTCDTDLNLIKQWKDDMLARNLSMARTESYIVWMEMVYRFMDFDLYDAEQSDLKDIISRINQNDLPGKDYSPRSRKELKSAIKQFYLWLDREEMVEFITITLKECERKRLDRRELPGRDDVQHLAAVMENYRDKALISLLWDSGGRIGEILDICWKDISFIGKRKAWITLKGKTGQRTVPIYESVPMLQEWQSRHPNQVGSGEVFCSFQDPDHGHIQYNSARKQVREAREKTIIEDHVKTNFHAFRKGRATYLAAQGFNAPTLCKYFGWSRLETARTYIRLANTDLEDSFDELYQENPVVIQPA